MAIAVRCVVRAPPKTSLVVRRAGAAQDESGGGRLSVQSFSTSLGIGVDASFQRTQGPPATPCRPRSKQWVNGIRIVELQAGVRPPFSWSAACLLVLFFWRAPSMAAPMGWRVLPSLVVLGLPLPLPRLSRRDRLIMCKSPPSPRNIAQWLLLQVLALCRTKTLGNRSLQFSAPSTALPLHPQGKGGHRQTLVIQQLGSSNHGALLRAAKDGARTASSPSEWVASILPFQGNHGWLESA